MKIVTTEAHQTKLVEEIVAAGGSLETVSALNQDIEALKGELIDAQERIEMLIAERDESIRYV